MAVEAFLTAVKELAERSVSVSEVIHTAETLKAAGETHYAVQIYRLWISTNNTDPMVCVGYFNLSALLTEIGDLAGAKDALERAIAANPDLYPAYINIGGVLEKLGAADKGIAQWSTMVSKLALITGTNISYKTTALKQIGRVFEAHHDDLQAEAVLQQLLSIDPHQADAVQHFLSLRLVQCKWPVVVPWESVGRKELMVSISPLSLSAYTDDPMLQLATACNYNKTIGDHPAVFQGGERRPGPLRIGYVSSDLREHAVGFLMAELFELHDNSKFEIFAYYCGIPQNDSTKERIKRSVGNWVDISGMDDLSAARRIAADGIDILIDVNGYTRDMRTKVFALRPAPVIVNWLGYPGSMGSPYHHYIIADDWIIPPDHEIYYSEKVLRLPCYQPNDRKRVVSKTPATRKAANLPENAVVYCCFNGSQKIRSFTLERWAAILARVPNSVLWLLDRSETTNKRLVDFIEQRGIARDRVIFAGKLSNPDHLARYPLADLFLDTLPYGAHTTASDALWMGVPILTISGRGFASRVCGSLARSADLGELVCSTPEDYVEMAVALGNDRPKLARYKKHLAAKRDSCVLFDMDSHVRHLEGLYAQMWDEYQQGKLPTPDLDNLEVYQEIGIEQDHEAIEVAAIKDYRGWYRSKLARRHRMRPIRDDRRLWTVEDIALAAKTAE